MSWNRVRRIPSTAAEPHPGWETPGLGCGFLGTEKRFPDGDQRGSDRARGPAEGPTQFRALSRAVAPPSGSRLYNPGQGSKSFCWG